MRRIAQAPSGKRLRYQDLVGVSSAANNRLTLMAVSWRVREALKRGLQSEAGSAAARQRERNDALVRRVGELEEKPRSCHRGSVRPVSRRLFRRRCASGIAFDTRPQKSVEWF